MEHKCAKQRDDYLEQVKLRAKAQERKLLSKARSEAQKKIIIKKNELLVALKKDLMAEIELITLTEEYEHYFHTHFEEAMKPLADEDDLLIGLKARDLAYIPFEMKTFIDDKIIGGFYIIKNGKVKYDYTLNSEVDDLEEYLGCMINALFNPTQEACGEAK